MSKYEVMICPGHHLKRKGAVSPHYPQYNEHDVAAAMLYDIVNALGLYGIEAGVAMGTLPDKVATINRAKPRLAIDLHFNADNDHTDPLDKDNKRGAGTCVLYYPGSVVRMRQAARMSATIAQELMLVDNGAQEAWYWGDGTKPDYFTARTTCPAFILEPFFIDNKLEVDTFLVGGRTRTVVDAVTASVVDILKVL